MNESRGRLITFEGGEGAGKTTAIAAVASALEMAGHPFLVTREPGGTPVGERIRGILLAEGADHPRARSELFLFLASRAQLVDEVVGPALASGRHVLCDRYEEATIAYQVFGRGLNEEAVAAGCALASGGLSSDLVILLDIDPEVGLARTMRRTGDAGQRRLEGEPAAFHRRVREGYLALARRAPGRFLVVDASLPAETVAGECAAAVLGLLGAG